MNAAAAYLAELHSGDSRRAVRSRLNIAARWLGAADAFCCEWGRLRYVHVLGFMHALADKEGLAAASVNAYLSALKGVAETAWRLRQIDLTTYAEIKAVKQLRVHGNQRAVRFRPMSLRSFWLRSMRTPDLKRFAIAH